MELTKYEKVFLKTIEDAKKRIPVGYELEVDHINKYLGGDEQLDEDLTGWYACKYDGDQSTPLEVAGYDTTPLISDINKENFNVDVYKVFEAANVYYCG